MAPPFDVASYFDDLKYSDVTIKFADQEVKCHEIFLCSKSEYFEKLCGPSSSFAEAGAKVIELKDDDPEALRALLRYIYDGDLSRTDKGDWKFQLELTKAADKYLLGFPKSTAMSRFRTKIESLKNMKALLEAIDTIHAAGTTSEQIEVARSLESKHGSALLKLDKYRNAVEPDKERLWAHIDRFNYEADIVEAGLWTCSKCKKTWAYLANPRLVATCISATVAP